MGDMVVTDCSVIMVSALEAGINGLPTTAGAYLRISIRGAEEPVWVNIADLDAEERPAEPVAWWLRAPQTDYAAYAPTFRAEFDHPPYFRQETAFLPSAFEVAGANRAFETSEREEHERTFWRRFADAFRPREKEEEFGPGDTKLLDEYLNSFMRAGA